MKFHRLFNNFSPKKKCGPDPLFGVGLGLEFLGGIGETLQADEAVTRNLRENERNRQFNHDEAIAQRAWQSAEWDKQFEKQSQEWYKQNKFNQDLSYQYWLKEQEYASPIEQIQRLNAAGLNANAMFNNGNVGGLAPASSIPSAPSSISPSVPAASAASISTPNPAVASSRADMIRSIGSFVSDISKVYVENEKLRPEIDQILGNIKNQELVNEGLQLDNAFRSLTLGHRAEKAKNEMLASTIQLAILENQKENISEDTLLKIQERHKSASEVLLNELQGDKLSVESALVLKEVLSYDERLASDLRTQASERSRNYAAASDYSASAALHKAVASVYHDEHAEFVYNRLVRGLDDNGKPTNLQFFNQERESYRRSLIESINKSEMSEYQKTQCKLAADKLQKDVDWYEFNMIVGEIGTIAGAATGAVFAGAAVGRAGSLGRLAEEQAKKLERSAGGWSALGYRGNDMRFSDGRFH